MLAAAAPLKGQVKITGLETDVLRFPPGRPFADAIHDFGKESGGVVLRLRTDAGITGWAYSSFGMIAGGPRVVEAILENEVKPVVAGQGPGFPEAACARNSGRLWNTPGVQGVTQFAIAAVDIAVWDILGKAAGLPVYKMLGAYRPTACPVYSMCGWYYENDDDLAQFKTLGDAPPSEQGFDAVKIKVGRDSLDDDVRRITAAQAIAGKGRRVMVDANQVFNLNEAIRRGRVYQQMGCFWFEEPLAPQDDGGLCGAGARARHPHRHRRERVYQVRLRRPDLPARLRTWCSRITAVQVASRNGWRSRPSPTVSDSSWPATVAARPT